MTEPGRTLLELQNVGFTYRTRAGIFGHHYCEALTEISFSLRAGETLGIIGRNGCGKSTLLKILSGIYQPDHGVILRHCDRVALLSLAIGFDPELSGSNNLILACMLLGSDREEAFAHHDEIVEFAELEDFIQEPLKTYSAGMKARLGFSVGLKMNADLLLIDEVLGVGDAAFNDKATEAMKHRINSAQSVIFVSHTMPSVRKLCTRVLWREGGRIREAGEPGAVIKSYMTELKSVHGVGNIAVRRSRLRA